MNNQRYNRQIKLKGFGEDAQQKLSSAKVLIIGAGGLGVPVMQYLVGMGVGTLGLIDGDTVKLDNLHRQVLYAENDVGKIKVAAAKERLGQFNSTTRIHTYPEFLSAHNALEIISTYDVIVDASDNFGTRYLINDACVILNKPFIYGAVQEFEGQVSVFNYNGGPTYRCLFPNPAKAVEIRDCNNAGVLGVAPGIIGCRQALETVKVITGIGKSLSGHLYVLDMLNDREFRVKLTSGPANKQIQTLENTYETPVCELLDSLTVETLRDWFESERQFTLIDVRNTKEFNKEHLETSLSIPLSFLKSRINELDASMPILTVCEIGGRSARAADILREAFPNAEIFNLAGGLEAWFDKYEDLHMSYIHATAK